MMKKLIAGVFVGSLIFVLGLIAASEDEDE